MAAEDALAGVLRAIADPRGMEQDARRAGVVVVGAVKLKLSQPGKGRVYRTRRVNLGGRRGVGKTSRLHRASAPGDPPAVDTGVLRQSYDHHAETVPGAAVLRVFSRDYVASLLELGTTRILPRPHVRPAVEETRQVVVGIMYEGARRRAAAAARARGGRA